MVPLLISDPRRRGRDIDPGAGRIADRHGALVGQVDLAAARAGLDAIAGIDAARVQDRDVAQVGGGVDARVRRGIEHATGGIGGGDRAIAVGVDTDGRESGSVLRLASLAIGGDGAAVVDQGIGAGAGGHHRVVVIGEHRAAVDDFRAALAGPGHQALERRRTHAAAVFDPRGARVIDRARSGLVGLHRAQVADQDRARLGDVAAVGIQAARLGRSHAPRLIRVTVPLLDVAVMP